MSETRLQLETRQQREFDDVADGCGEVTWVASGYALGVRHGLELAELEAREKEGGGGWQPIATAPRDGSLILTWGECRAQYAVSYWDEDDEVWYTDFREKGNISIVYATHWMPLPLKPEVSE